MKFDFNEMTERRGTSSYKWDGEGDAPDVLPLWVADMDFRTAPAITEALQRRVSSGIFGYVSVPESYYAAIIGWFERRHGWKIERESIIYTTGVVPAISAIIKALTKPGDGVILQTPAYNCFYSSIRNNGCLLAENPLLRRETSDGFTYDIDFDRLEQIASRPANKLLILCNPHNPSGRIWSREELERVSEICRRNGVRVVSDEIHCELVHPHAPAYVPYATVESEAIVCCSPSKAFNTAGLQIANIICPDAETRSRIDRAINDNEVCDVNPFGVTGLQAAYNEGSEWLDALNEYLYENYRLLRTTFAERLPEIKVCDSDSTYLSWIDIRPTGLEASELARKLLEEGKVRISAGDIYGDNHYIRINYACPRARLCEALERIVKVIRKAVEEAG